MASEAILLEREKRRTAREERLMSVVSSPHILGIIGLLGGLYAAQKIHWSEDEVTDSTLQGIATGGVVLLSVSQAGITGWPAVGAAVASGALAMEKTKQKPIVTLDWSGFWKNITGQLET